MEHRRHSVGVYVVFELAWAVNRIALPNPLWGQPAFVELEKIAGNLVGWSNDIFSLAKELAHRDPHNFVLLLQRDRQLTLEQAFQYAVSVHEAEMSRFETALTALPAFGRDSLPAQHYAQMLSACVGAHLDWALETSRYGVAPRLIEA